MHHLAYLNGADVRRYNRLDAPLRVAIPRRAPPGVMTGRWPAPFRGAAPLGAGKASVKGKPALAAKSTDDRIRHQILDELRHHMPRLGVRVIRDIYEHARWSPEGGNYKASYEQLASAHRCSRRTVMRYVRYAVAVGCLAVRADKERLPDGTVVQYPNVFSPCLNGSREIRMTYADFLRRREPIDYGGRPMRERQDEARWRRDRGPEKSGHPAHVSPRSPE